MNAIILSVYQCLDVCTMERSENFTVSHELFVGPNQDILFIKPAIVELKLLLLLFWDQLLGFSSRFLAFGEISLWIMTEIWFLLIPLMAAFLVEILLARWLPLVSESSLECLWIFFIFFGCAGFLLLQVNLLYLRWMGATLLVLLGFSLQWLLLLSSMGSRHMGFSCFGAQASSVLFFRIFPDQGSNWYPLHC